VVRLERDRFGLTGQGDHGGSGAHLPFQEPLPASQNVLVTPVQESFRGARQLLTQSDEHNHDEGSFKLFLGFLLYFYTLYCTDTFYTLI